MTGIFASEGPIGPIGKADGMMLRETRGHRLHKSAVLCTKVALDINWLKLGTGIRWRFYAPNTQPTSLGGLHLSTFVECEL